ncbi:hypothetical protein THPR109532_20055 [Thalassospira profundimaris]
MAGRSRPSAEGFGFDLAVGDEPGEIGKPRWDAGLAARAPGDGPAHPALDRRVDGALDGELARQSVGNVVRKMPPISAVEEVAHRVVRAARGAADPRHGQRPGLKRVAVVGDGAEEAPVGVSRGQDGFGFHGVVSVSVGNPIQAPRAKNIKSNRL